MTDRDWIIVVLDNIDEMNLKLRKVVRKMSDEELEDLHHGFYDDLGLNIYNNFQFMYLVITGRLKHKKRKNKRRMNNEEIGEYLREHWTELVSEMFRKPLKSEMINDPESFLFNPSIFQKN